MKNIMSISSKKQENSPCLKDIRVTKQTLAIISSSGLTSGYSKTPGCVS